MCKFEFETCPGTAKPLCRKPIVQVAGALSQSQRMPLLHASEVYAITNLKTRPQLLRKDLALQVTTHTSYMGWLDFSSLHTGRSYLSS